MMPLMAWRQFGKCLSHKPTMFSVDLTFSRVEESLQVCQQPLERMKIGSFLLWSRLKGRPWASAET